MCPFTTQSVVVIGRSILEVISLAKDLPSHCDQLVRILDAVLTSYKETCQGIYSTIVSPEDKKLISATMVKDEDIERLLKSLPNWSKLQKRKDYKRLGSTDESPEEVSSQSVRESDLFFGLFGGKTVQLNDILLDLKLIEQLAHLQESMVRM
jgi:exocyst complex component 4